MKCLTILTIVLIVGSLACISAQSYTNIINMAMSTLEKQCESNGVSKQTVVEARRNLQRCIGVFFNFITVQNEINKAKPTGELDEVFIKYCEKKNDAMKCMSAFMENLEPCFQETEYESSKTINNVTESLLDFVCNAEGNRIAMFIAEGGVECLEAKQPEIQVCFNTTIGNSDDMASKVNVSGVSSLTHLQNQTSTILDEKTCNDITTFQKCAVEKLETCEKPTTANIVDSLMRYMMKNTPCQEVKKSSKSSANDIISSLLTTVVLAIALLI